MIGGRQNLDIFLNDESGEEYSFCSNGDFVKLTDRSTVKEIEDRYKIKSTTVIRYFSKEKRDEAIR